VTPRVRARARDERWREPLARHQAPKVRAFIDFLIERLGPAPWRMGANRNR
jgi:hypothetical protein